MKLIPIYRVHKDNHNSQYFFTRSCAEDMALAKDAEVDICYRYNHEQAQELIERENAKKWQKGDYNGQPTYNSIYNSIRYNYIA